MKNNIRERLIDLLEQADGQVNNDIPSLEMIADYLIANDVVPVVMCKDCKYHYWEKEPEYGKTIHFCSVLNSEVFKDFYCYHGTPKEKGGSRNERNYIQRKTDR